VRVGRGRKFPVAAPPVTEVGLDTAKFAYEEAARGIAEQSLLLDGFRARAATLATLTGAITAATALASSNASTLVRSVFTAGVAVLFAATIALFHPRKWRTRLDVAKALAAARRGESEARIRERVAQELETASAANDEVLKQVTRWFRTALAGVALVAVALILHVWRL
jgi:hypothetical protein